MVAFDRRTSFNAVDLMATEFPPPRWAIPGLLAEGLTICAGAPKLGKSWMVLNIAVAVASGGHALGKVPVDPGEVLYLALEDSPRRLQERLKMSLKGAAVPERLHFETEWLPLKDGGAEDLDAWLSRHPDCRLVVIDVLARVRTAAGEKSDRYQTDYMSVEPLKILADRHQTAILCVHHTRKQTAEDFLESVSGTNGLSGAADTTMVLKRSRTAVDAELYITGRDVEEQKLALSFSPEVGTWTLQGDARQWAVSKTRRDIIEAIETAGMPLTPKEISELCEPTHDVVRQLVRKMADEGQLDALGEGRYITPSLRSLVHPPVNVVNREKSQDPLESEEVNEVNGLPTPPTVNRVNDLQKGTSHDA